VRPSWTLSADSVQRLDLYIGFQPSGDNQAVDLDGAIYFLGYAQGNFCLPKDKNGYIYYYGDGNGTAAEYFSVNLGDAFADLAWSGSTMVNLRAGWYGFIDHGQANVTMYTQRLLSDGTYVYDQNMINFVVDPIAHGAENCPPLVANASVSIGVGGKVTITVTA
jgi:hypothetical protein